MIVEAWNAGVRPETGSWAALVRAPSLLQATTDLAVGRCQSLCITHDNAFGAQLLDLIAICALRPLASVWGLSPGGRWEPIAIGEWIQESLREAGVRAIGAQNQDAPLTTIRAVWQGAFCRAVFGVHGQSGQHALETRCLIAAVRQPKSPGLATRFNISERTLRRRLTLAGVQGPQRIVAVARVFAAWERAQYPGTSAESAVLGVGYGSLSAFDHALGRLELPSIARLRELSDDMLAQMLAPLVRRGYGDRLDQIVADSN